ncbi:hypothetical protein ACQ4PT_040874 [Festuca glaucescens]
MATPQYHAPVMSMIIFITIVCTAAFSSVGLGKHIAAQRLDKIPAVSGLYMFSYAGHIVFPNIYMAMKDPSSFTKVSITSFSLVTVLYTALAFVGANLFGPTVNSQVTLSMPPRLVFTRVALWATVLTPVTKYALEFAPFAIQLEHHLPATMEPRARVIIRGSIGSAGLLLILALALSVPYFQYVLSLTGSLISVAISVPLRLLPQDPLGPTVAACHPVECGNDRPWFCSRCCGDCLVG